jgi:uncharacterized protein
VAIVLAGAPHVRAQGSVPFPDPTGRVNDFANLLDPRVEADLDALLQQTEDKTTAEVAVVTVPTLQGLTVEDYAERLFRRWGIGQEKVDNGVLVLVALAEREMRIEVGYGLEGVQPDGLAGEIIRTTFIPHFRNNDYPRGIEEGVRRVAEIVQRNHVLTAEEVRAIADSTDDRPPMWMMLPFFGIFASIGFFTLGQGLGSKSIFPLIFGSVFALVSMIFSLIPFFNAPISILGPVALVMFIAGGVVGRKRLHTYALAGGTRRHVGWAMERDLDEAGGSGSRPGSASISGSPSSSSSDSSPSSSWSSGSSSSSSSGSSSSFGGGSSGGGGASGKW